MTAYMKNKMKEIKKKLGNITVRKPLKKPPIKKIYIRKQRLVKMKFKCYHTEYQQQGSESELSKT